MGRTPEECEQRLSARERAVAADEAESQRLLTEARAAHRAADRERNRARKLADRLARKVQHALETARAQLDIDRAAVAAQIAKLNEARSAFHAASAAERDRCSESWRELDARQKRLTAEWEETNRFHADQTAALGARAAELAAREKVDADAKAQLQREVAALREEAAGLDARVRNTRQLVDELEQRRVELRTEVPAPAANTGAEPPDEVKVALDRAADRDIGKWAAELEERDERLRLERAAVHALFATVSKDKAELADRRRVLAEQFEQLAAARAQWQEAERATVAEMEQLARTLRRREAELDARDQRLTRADARRREDGYALWQLRLRLEAWQSKIVVYEMQWHTEREELEAEFNRRAAALARRELELAARDPGADPDAIPLAMVVPEPDAPALPAELVSLRAELDRLAAVLLEADLPEPPESTLPWGTEEPEVPIALPFDSDDDEMPTALPFEPDADVLLFESPARAA
jgi:chromosome segregation ATPase